MTDVLLAPTPTPTGTGRPQCQHEPPCPPADAADHDAAHVIADHLEQGWSLLCNGVVLFTDSGELLPDGSLISPRPTPALHTAAL